MKRVELIGVLREMEEAGRYIFTRQHLARLFPDDEPSAFAGSLERLVRDGLLLRISRGLYLNPHARLDRSYVLEQIAIFMRRGCFNYVSLESVLSEFGAISQAPVDRLTVMTTGRRGTYRTPFGVIEFTHTKRSREDILQSTRRLEGRPLRVATLQAAWRDLKRVGRNTEMVDQSMTGDYSDGRL
jgi:predicted transcriptional regulator of viral defense system